MCEIIEHILTSNRVRRTVTSFRHNPRSVRPGLVVVGVPILDHDPESPSLPSYFGDPGPLEPS